LAKLESQSNLELYVTKLYYEPYAIALANETVLALQAEIQAIGATQLSEQTLEKVKEDTKQRCVNRQSRDIAERIGEHPCSQLPRYVIAGTRKGGDKKTLQAAKLRFDYWNPLPFYPPVTLTGRWEKKVGANYQPVTAPTDRAISRIELNESHILHYRPRLKNWWQADVLPGEPAWRYPLLPSADCPPDPQGGPEPQCDEFPNAASYEGGPYLPPENLSTNAGLIFGKSAAWLRAIDSEDNGSEGTAYGSFLQFAGLLTAWPIFSSAEPQLSGAKTLTPDQGLSVAFIQQALPIPDLPSFGVRMVNGVVQVKLL
jgi:hypothetical protein